MTKKQQLWLPKIERVAKTLKSSRTPQPRLGKDRLIKKYELLYRPFDLRFRGKLNLWLESLKTAKKLNLPSTLSKLENKLIELYLLPEPKSNKWLTQKEVRNFLPEISQKKFRKTLVAALIKIWEEAKKARQ